MQGESSQQSVHVHGWRRGYERDREDFVRAHGRAPASLYELSRWLATQQPVRQAQH
jgi:hypothetical protein